jgi:carboxymethylenebutenolidase
MRSLATETNVHGYLAAPESGGAGLVVLHDVWGLYDHYRDLARRFAAEGFVTLAVDLYRYFEARPLPEDPGAFMRELSDPLVISEIQAAVDYLRALPNVTEGRVAVTGFCMGGAYTILAGASVSAIAAIAPFYGILSYRTGLYASSKPLDPAKKPREPLDAASSLRCPMLGFFGADDVFITEADVRELERRVSAGVEPARVHVYEGAGHAFMNDTRPAAYRPGAAEDAWGKLVAFLHERLDAPRAPT